MKVAVVTQYFPTSYQPWAGHSAYQTLRLLAKRCELEVFYPEAVYPPGLTPRSGRRPVLDRTWNPPDVRVTYIPYRVMPLLTRPLNGFFMKRRLINSVRQYQPDVILSYVVYPDGHAATLIGREQGVPVVLTAIGSDLNRISDPLCGFWTRSALRHATTVTTVSRDLARTAIAMGADPEHTIAILNGCDTTLFFPKRREAERAVFDISMEAEVVLYVGRLDLRKGLMELIEAVAILRLRRPRLRCFIVGDGPDSPALQQAITRSGTEDVIRLVPSCPTREIAQWMGAADVVTLPSYREGCPNVVLEALASGRPMVASDVGGIPELMDESCGKLVAPMSVSSLEHGLDAVLGKSWSGEAIAKRHSRSWGDVADDLYLELSKALDRG